jgi:hypothetical protein
MYIPFSSVHTMYYTGHQTYKHLTVLHFISDLYLLCTYLLYVTWLYANMFGKSINKLNWIELIMIICPLTERLLWLNFYYKFVIATIIMISKIKTVKKSIHIFISETCSVQCTHIMIDIYTKRYIWHTCTCYKHVTLIG